MGPARRRWLTLLVVVGCAKGGTPDTGDAPGGRGDACTVWYADADEDGHGDPNAGAASCSQPAKAVDNDDDCDDKDRYRFPGAAEVCDGLDNDCNAASMETCPASCQPMKRPPPDTASTYLFCNSDASWQNAQATCAAVSGFRLVQLNDAAENSWVRSQATTIFGTTAQIHIGANDTMTEGFWRWDGNNNHFWQGQATGGMAIMGAFTSWSAGEPNDSGNEDCGEIRGDGLWNDSDCIDGQRFVCER